MTEESELRNEGNEGGEDFSSSNGMTPIQKMVGMLLSPSKTFEQIKIKPDWLIPMIFILFATLTVQLVSKPYFFNSRQYEKLIEDTVEKTGMDRESVESMMQKQMGIMMPIGGLVMTPIIILVFAGLFFFGGNIILGGTTDFRTMFSLNVYVGVIGSLGLLLKLPLIIAKGSTDILTNLAILMPADMDETILYKLLNMIDVILIWQTVLLAMGFVIIYDWQQKKANTLVIGIWVLVITVYGVVLALS